MTNNASDTRQTNPFEASTGRTRRNWMIAIGLLVVAALTVTLFSTRREAPVANTETHNAASHNAQKSPTAGRPLSLSAREAQRIGVTFATVTLQPVEREIRTVAQITYDETRIRAVAPKVDGFVEQLYVNYTGQPVAAGQALLSIYSPMLVSAQEELLLARRLSTSLSGASSDARDNSVALAAAARRRLQYWDVSASEINRIEQTGQVTRTLTFRSPYSGVVIEKNVLAGQRIMAGDPIYKIVDLSTVWVEGEVFERDLPGVRVGETVTADFDALPGDTRTGRITYLYPTLNAETRTARIRVTLANPGLRLKPGMYATIRIAGTSQTVLSVPRSAVLSTGERNLVFVRRSDGMLEPRNVTIGESTEDRTRILSGVTAGETVVASATFLVDAESNLGSSLGGMGDMPGMDMTSPAPKKE